MKNSMVQYILDLKEQYPDRTAFQWVSEQDESIVSKSYPEFVDDILRCAGFFRQHGMKKAAHVGILAQNSYHYAVNVFAVLLCDAVAVPLNHREQWEVICAELNAADIDMVIVDDTFQSRAQELNILCAQGTVGLMDYIACEEMLVADKSPRDLNQTAVLMFTSGTTSANKCVELSLKNLFVSTEPSFVLVDWVRKEYGIAVDKYFYILPMYHIYGFSHFILFVALGIQMNLCNNYRYLYRDLQVMDSNFSAAVPMIMETWCKDIMRGNRDRLGGITSIVSGGAGLPAQVVDLLKSNGIQIIGAYGMTESFTRGTCNLMNDSRKNASIGRADCATEVKFEDGELCLKTEACMKG